MHSIAIALLIITHAFSVLTAGDQLCPSKESKNGSSIGFHDAVFANDVQAIKDLVSKQAEGINSWHHKTGQTPLLNALNSYPVNIELIRALLDAKADCNQRCFYEESSPLDQALDEDVAVLALLLEYQADPNEASYEGDVPLLHVLSDGSLEKSRLLIQHGADVNVFGDVEGEQSWPLAVAVDPFYGAILDNDRLEMVALLLEYKANVNQVGPDGNTALHASVRNEISDCTEMLIKHNADVNAQNKAGVTPLGIAIKAECEDSERLLCCAGANPSLEDILLLVKHKHRSKAKKLIKHLKPGMSPVACISDNEGC